MPDEKTADPKAEPAAKSDAAPLPQKVRLTRPFGFIEDGGRDRFWKAGTIVTGAEEIALLTERTAPIEVV